MEPSDVPSDPEFSVGTRYLRKEIHDEFGGQRQYGISTPANDSCIFVFTDPSTEEYGYRDRFRNNGLFVYSGEGRVGDMEMAGGNDRIRHHSENGDDLLVFEVIDELDGADVVTYTGQYEYVDHYWERARDDTGTVRDAIRFVLAPLGGIDSGIPETDLDELSDDELFERAKTSGTTGHGSGGTAEGMPRSRIVREYALRVADGTCQACGEDAPFVGNDGEPFLEVHHLHRVSDGGVDDPENVVAVCPNCHREIHHGRDGNKINRALVEEAAARNERPS